jgi:hypothetical protein
MAGPSLVVPEVLDTVPSDGVARVEQWAALCRADLSRRALSLSAIVRRAQRLESELAGSAEPAPDVLATIDADLAAASASAEAAVASAQDEAAGIVARAAGFAANIVRLAGLDPAAVEGLESQSPARSVPTFQPRGAADLWRDTAVHTPSVGTANAFLHPTADDPMTQDPDRDFWSEVTADRSPFGRIRRRVAEQWQ